MKPERTISIAFIKMFREHLDDTFGGKNISDEHANTQAQKAIYVAFGDQYGKITSPQFDQFTEQLKIAFKHINDDLLKEVYKTYDKALPDIITTTMEQIEIYLKNQFNETELIELAELSSSPLIVRLFGSNEIFQFMKKEKSRLFDIIEEGFSVFSEDSENQKRIHSAIMGVVKDFRNDNQKLDKHMSSYDENEDYEEDEQEDENDEFEF